MAEPASAPRDFDSLRAELIERRQSLPKRLTQVAAFAIDHPDEIAFGTVATIAEQADVQPSTLVRFAQALGYGGFSEMQKVFRSRLREGVADYRERLDALKTRDADAGPMGLLDGFCEAAFYSLTRLRSQMDGQQLDRAVAALVSAETIYLVGQRRSFPVTAYLAYAFSKIGIRNVLVDNVASMAPEMLRFATPRDAVVAVSFTPYSSVTVDLASDLAAQKVPIVSITDSAFSPLTQCSTAWVEIVEADFGGFRSVAGTFALAIALAVAVGERRNRGP
jgi:DNA-binding MurR/RpiR family transcriptional regulator